MISVWPKFYSFDPEMVLHFHFTFKPFPGHAQKRERARERERERQHGREIAPAPSTGEGEIDPHPRAPTNPEKKIIKSGQIKRRRNRERWLGSTRGCNWCGASRDRDRRKGEIAIGAVLCAIAIDGSWDRDRRFARSRSTWRRDRDWREGEIVIDAVLCAISVISVDYFGGRARLSLWRDRSWAKALYSLFFLSLSLSLSLALSLFCAWPWNGLKVKWNCKTISESKE